MPLNDEQAKVEVEANEPPITPGQTWSIYDSEEKGSKLIRQLLILGRHPVRTNNILTEDVGGTKFSRSREIGSCPEYNLRRIFRPDPGEGD